MCEICILYRMNEKKLIEVFSGRKQELNKMEERVRERMEISKMRLRNLRSLYDPSFNGVIGTVKLHPEPCDMHPPN